MQYTHYAYIHIHKDLHSLWKVGKRLIDIFMGRELVEKKFLKSLPDWKLLDNVTHVDWSRMGWIAI